jgi:alkylhydroperoxidase/carboxymuconolactone decarboxylase family protein YurZ
MLKLDKGQYEKEAEVIASVAMDLDAQIAAKKAELSQLYGSIMAYRDRLVKHQRELASISNAAALSTSP